MHQPVYSIVNFRVTDVSAGDLRSCRCLMASLAALIVIAVAFANQATATPYNRHYGSSSSSARRAVAAARAQRAQMIKGLQNQVSNARQVLKNVESQSVMTQSQLTSASSKLEGIQQGIEDTHQDAVQAAKTLRDLEDEIMLEQSSTSEFGKASAAADEAKKAAHLTLHTVLHLPLEDGSPDADALRADLQKISDSQRAALEADARYKDADKKMKDALRNVSQVRLKRFQADKDWVTAHQDLIDANQKKRGEEKDRRVAGTAVTGKKHELQNMASVAANARSVISMGEYRLRQLGASAGSTQKSTSSTSRQKSR